MQIIEMTDSSWVVMSCLSSLIEAVMEDYMVLLMAATLALLFHFLLGLNETILQGIEVSFQFLAMSMGHEDGETEKGWAG